MKNKAGGKACRGAGKGAGRPKNGSEIRVRNQQEERKQKDDEAKARAVAFSHFSTKGIYFLALTFQYDNNRFQYKAVDTLSNDHIARLKWKYILNFISVTYFSHFFFNLLPIFHFIYTFILNTFSFDFHFCNQTLILSSKSHFIYSST